MARFKWGLLVIAVGFVAGALTSTHLLELRRPSGDSSGNTMAILAPSSSTASIPPISTTPTTSNPVTATAKPRLLPIVDAPYALVLDDLGFLQIPEGDAILGSPDDEPGHQSNERQRLVHCDSFLLLATEITQATFERVMQANPSQVVSPTLPVTNVSYDDVELFLSRLETTYPAWSFRLPTEHEWEYACRAGHRGAFAVPIIQDEESQVAIEKAKSGDEQFLERFIRHFANFGSSAPDRVAERSPNGWGLFDLTGNVWEWCDGQTSDPQLRPVRGGAWSSTNVWGVRNAVRSEEYRDSRKGSIGFRLVVEP